MKKILVYSCICIITLFVFKEEGYGNYWVEYSDKVSDKNVKIACLLKALQAESQNYDIYSRLGDIFFEAKEFDKALEYYNYGQRLIDNEKVEPPPIGDYSEFLPEFKETKVILSEPAAAGPGPIEELYYANAYRSENLIDKKLYIAKALKINPGFVKAKKYYSMLQKKTEIEEDLSPPVKPLKKYRKPEFYFFTEPDLRKIFVSTEFICLDDPGLENNIDCKQKKWLNSIGYEVDRKLQLSVILGVSSNELNLGLYRYDFREGFNYGVKAAGELAVYNNMVCNKRTI